MTVPPTEPPTTPEPTTTSTTTTSTTTTTLAPTTTLPLQSAWQIIQDEPRLDDLESLLNECNSTALPIISTLSDPNETLTFFAPNNQAIRDAGIDVTSCPGGGEAVIARHLLEDQALDEVQLATMTELTMSSGETVDIVASGDTVDTIGGAQIVDPDLEASNGYVHVVDALLMPAP